MTLRPQHLHTCVGPTKFRNGGGNDYRIWQMSSKYVSNFSGISVANTVVKIAKSLWVPLLIMNNTKQMVTLKRRFPFAKFWRAGNITEITMPDRQKNKNSDIDLEQVHVSEKFKPDIMWLLKRNMDLFVIDKKPLAGLILWRCESILECMRL